MSIDPSQFYLLVLPLGTFVFALAFLVYYYARREEFAQRKLKRLIRTYVKKRIEQKEAMNRELGKLEELRQNKSIDQITFERLKHLLEKTYEQKGKEIAAQYASFAREEEITSDESM